MEKWAVSNSSASTGGSRPTGGTGSGGTSGGSTATGGVTGGGGYSATRGTRRGWCNQYRSLWTDDSKLAPTGLQLCLGNCHSGWFAQQLQLLAIHVYMGGFQY